MRTPLQTYANTPCCSPHLLLAPPRWQPLLPPSLSAHTPLPSSFFVFFSSSFRPTTAACVNTKGVWLSPWGGYAYARGQRMIYGHKNGFETNKNGFSLAGPKYFKRFLETCSEFVSRHGARFFKFDGIAGGFVTSGPPPQFAQDVFGLFELIKQLRKLKDDLFINLTVGTWPVVENPPLATKNLLEDTDGLRRSPFYNPSVPSRCGSPLLSAEMRALS